MAAGDKVHPFEIAGLGAAPFRCVGVHQRRTNTGQPGGACAYCGTGILDCFEIVSRDGKRFIVGCDCVTRTYAACDTETPVEFRRIKARLDAEKRQMKREAAWQRLQARCAKAAALLADDPDLFTTEPHPHPYHAEKGLRKRDYLGWMLQYGGDRGKTDACTAIEQATDNRALVSGQR